MKILVTGAWSQGNLASEKLNEMGHEAVFMQNENEALPCSADEFDGVICNGLFLHHDIEEFTNLKYIQLTSVGLDRVPMGYVNEKGIKIYNAGGVYSVPMAEFAISGVLQLYKKANFFCANQKAHKWEKNRELREINGKTVCIVGCGNVGSECAKRFSAFGSIVFGVDIFSQKRGFFDEMEPIDNLKGMLRLSDIVVLTLPLTEETKGLINEETLSCFKKNAVLVNVSRGGIVETEALIKALGENLGGAVLDVFEDEPLEENSPLWDLDNVIITPHNSFVSDGNSKRLWDLIFDNIRSAK